MSNGADIASRPTRDTRTAWRVIDGEAVVVLPATGKVHTLNRVATRYWELADGNRTTGEIAALIAEDFDASPERIAADIDSLARELVERGLLSEAAG